MITDLDPSPREKSESPVQTAAKWCVDFVRPAIATKSCPRKRPQSRTAYLDGLRGFAAFLVYWQHHELWPLRERPAGQILENGFGFDGQYYFAALPVVRTLFTGGHFGVAVFFVISGYVLSAKPLSLIGSGEIAKLGENVGSALFRRWLRLHLPILAVSLMYLTSWHLFDIWTLAPDHEPTFRQELWHWYTEFKNYSFLFRNGGPAWLTYNFPAWSLPIEFRGSIIVYTVLIACSRFTRNARLWMDIGLIYYFMYIVDGWFGALFVAGMLLCDLDLLALEGNLPSWIARLEPYKTPIYYAFFGMAMFLSGVPSHAEDYRILDESPGWHWIAKLKPEAYSDQKWFFLSWAAVFFVSAIPRIWWLKAFFETPFNLYLGRISFSLYLIHGPVLWILGDRLYCAVGWYQPIHEKFLSTWINKVPLSHNGPLGLEPAFLLPHLILLPLTLWLSEIATKVIDEPSNRFAQWLYRQALPTPDPASEPLNG